jgi:hypothetical protein
MVFIGNEFTSYVYYLCGFKPKSQPTAAISLLTYSVSVSTDSIGSWRLLINTPIKEIQDRY